MSRLQLVTLLVVLVSHCDLASAQKIKQPRIGGIRDVEDNEEDEAFKEWGKMKEAPEPDIDLSKGQLSPDEVDFLVKRNLKGVKLAFAHLFPDPTGKRTMDDVNKRAKQWMTLLGTGGMLGNRIYATDENTIILSLEDGRDMFEVKDFCLLQSDIDYFEYDRKYYFREDEEREIKVVSKGPNAKKDKKKKKKKAKSPNPDL